MQKIAGFITSIHAVIERLRETGEISLHKEEEGKPGLKVKTGDALTDWPRTGVGQLAEPMTQLHETVCFIHALTQAQRYS